MAYGVDNASAVLIFYGSDYKNSFACRTGEFTKLTSVSVFELFVSF